MMDLSIIICTYNRCAGLKVTLQSLQSQELTDGFSWEIIVVDNNCTDDTSNIVKGFAQNSERVVRYVKEKNQGLSYARNTGVAEANGRYLLFIDDDEIAEQHLVKEIYDTFKRYKCDCVGGKIHLKCEQEMPKWLKKELWGFLTYLDYGDEPFIMDEKRYPFGGNMAFTREILKKIGVFNINLGRKGDRLIGGEEVDLFKRMLASGAKGIYQPKALIHHVTGKSRLRKKYFRLLHFNNGIQKALSGDDAYRCTILGVPLTFLKQFFKSIKNFISVLLFDGWDHSFSKELSLIWCIGFIKCKVERSLRK